MRKYIWILILVFVLSAQTVVFANDKHPEKENLRVNVFEKDYYPGYGATDPDYYYRKTLQTKEELIKAEWVIFRKTIFEQEDFQISVTAELLPEIRRSHPAISILKKFFMYIEAQITNCVTIQFDVKKKLFFRKKVKMGKHKIWFELQRAKKKFIPVSLDWKKCGETYEIHECPVSEEVGTEFRVLD